MLQCSKVDASVAPHGGRRCSIAAPGMLRCPGDAPMQRRRSPPTARPLNVAANARPPIAASGAAACHLQRWLPALQFAARRWLAFAWSSPASSSSGSSLEKHACCTRWSKVCGRRATSRSCSARRLPVAVTTAVPATLHRSTGDHTGRSIAAPTKSLPELLLEASALQRRQKHRRALSSQHCQSATSATSQRRRPWRSAAS